MSDNAEPWQRPEPREIITTAHEIEIQAQRFRIEELSKELAHLNAKIAATQGENQGLIKLYNELLDKLIKEKTK